MFAGVHLVHRGSLLYDRLSRQQVEEAHRPGGDPRQPRRRRRHWQRLHQEVPISLSRLFRWPYVL